MVRSFSGLNNAALSVHVCRPRVGCVCPLGLLGIRQAASSDQMPRITGEKGKSLVFFFFFLLLNVRESIILCCPRLTITFHKGACLDEANYVATYYY